MYFVALWSIPAVASEYVDEEVQELCITYKEIRVCSNAAWAVDNLPLQIATDVADIKFWFDVESDLAPNQRELLSSKLDDLLMSGWMNVTSRGNHALNQDLHICDRLIYQFYQGKD